MEVALIPGVRLYVVWMPTGGEPPGVPGAAPWEHPDLASPRLEGRVAAAGSLETGLGRGKQESPPDVLQICSKSGICNLKSFNQIYPQFKFIPTHVLHLRDELVHILSL